MRDWPKIKMSRIIWHWTAGNYSPSDLALEHYHFVIDGNGRYFDAVPIELNTTPLKSGYAAHTRNCNSDSIGISCCAMGNAIEHGDFGKWPLKANQIDTLITLSVALCHFYDIKVSPKTTLSHAEVQNNLGIAQRGKWDIGVFPFLPKLNTPQQCGDYIRAKVQEGLNVHIG